MNIAVVGATGMVGQEMLKVLEERNFPVDKLIPVASEKSVGKTVKFKDREIEIVGVPTALEMDIDIALFSAGGSFSKIHAPLFAEKGVTVIDNSSAWRMDENVKLIVPEINGQTLTEEDKIIANPNCSTIQLVLALAPLHQRYKLNRVVVSTYQSITGTGKQAVDQMENERSGKNVEMVYPYQIDLNCLPHCDVFLDNGYTKEEMKLVNESRKILDLPDLKLTATAVRVPVVGGHSEAVNISFDNEVDVDEVRLILQAAPGLEVMDNVSKNIYPMPLNAKGRDEVFVGRIRLDESQENTLNMWIVADNLRKGAATNAVQIAEYLVREKISA